MLMGMTISVLHMIFLGIEWPDIINFLLGMGTGFVLLSLAVAMLLISGQNKQKKRIVFSKQEPLSTAAIEEMITNKQKELTEISRVSDNAYFRVAFDLAFELMNEIAKYYFPTARYPLYELSAQEVIDLNYYITKRIDKLISGKFIGRFKKYKISTIVDILNKKKAIDNSKLMKINREYKISKIWTIGSAILNYANPIYWFRKLALKPSTTLVIKELCKFIIRIVGEETDKLYSKKMFAEPEDVAALEKAFDEAVQEAETLPEEESKHKAKS
ncbi:MAG: hypothetical protein WC479_04890 [Candidatus Izemoplasmatales bacterium]|nr:hypothetical protein [Candidatus Izemoplasmatales bacterium]MDD3865698.1 hypothetical protein [Candidatus Izemoplasmatales bacterium]